MLFTCFQVGNRREKLLNYMLFLRVTPTLPNTFINFASPIVDVPYHIFFLATSVGLIPAAYVTVRVQKLHHLYFTPITLLLGSSSAIFTWTNRLLLSYIF